MACALACMFASTACRERPREGVRESFAPLVGVALVGCADVIAGPVCRLGASRSLRVALPDGVSDVSLSTDASGGATHADGSLVPFDVPAGATRLEVTASVGGTRAKTSIALGESPPPAAWIEAARAAHHAGKGDEALRILDEGAVDAGVELQARAASVRARMILAAGDAAQAAEALKRSADLHAARGELSAAADDESARAYVLVEQTRDFAGAHEAIARMTTWSRDYPRGDAIAATERGTLALATGDVASGLASLEEAHAKAVRVGLDDIVASTEEERARALLAIGRLDEAWTSLTQLDATRGAAMSPCDRAALRTNLGWAALLARDAASSPDAASRDPAPPLRLAEEAYRTTCLDPESRANALLNLAWGRLQDGATSEARALVAQARAAVAQLDPLVALFALDLDGRIALASGDARGALAAYALLGARAAGTSKGDEARAEEGRSEALARSGDAAGALAAIERSEASVDELARSVPLGEGRGAFFWSRARVTRRHVQLLVESGRAGDALDAARAARARAFDDVHRVARAASLPPADRARWESALATYEGAREALVEKERDDWSLSAAALARAASARRAHDVELRASLNAIARDVFPRSPPPHAPLATADGVVALAFYPLDGAWAAFRVAHGEVHVDRVVASTDPAHVDEAAALLLASQAAAVRRAARVRWLPFEAMRDVDAHALLLDGEPLVARVPVEYTLDAPSDAPAATSGFTLVVADPTGTLRGARREGVALAASRPDAHLLVGADATRARVLADLPGASSLFFSGHAAYAGADGWDSALLLADGARLGVADVLTLTRSPAIVVLAACEGAREGARGGAPGLGLADAFIAAGASYVIAANRVLGDDDAERLTRALVSSLAATPLDAPAALREAELTLRRDSPASDWSAFRALGR